MIRQKILNVACLVAGAILLVAIHAAPLIMKGYENDQS
jgi:hypothetical protein